jgi:ectoine hydroxylase-related dioxygenase (phytanoyl-CoA dioxygenase family)
MFDINKYNNNGYYVLKNIISEKNIKKFESDIASLCTNITLQEEINSGKKRKNDFISVFTNKYSRKQLYTLLQDLQIIKIICYELDQKLSAMNIYKDFKINIPSIKNGLFISLPNEEKFNNPLHQDIYNYYSKNFFKIWAPLSEVNEKNGSMKIYEKSHEQGYIEPKYKDRPDYPTINEKNTLKFDSKILDISVGSIVIFNPLLLHKTVTNKSNHARFTLGIDIQDLSGVPMSSSGNSSIHKMRLISEERSNRRQKILFR